MTVAAPAPSGSPVGPDRLLVAASVAGDAIIAELFPHLTPTVVAADDLRVATPWQGRLFELLRPDNGALPAGGSAASVRGAREQVVLVVPMRWVAAHPAPELVIVGDHVNLRLRGPLTGRRPVSGPQPFPSLSGLYQPETIAAACRRAVRPRVYSVVAVAGVTDAADLTPFERRQAVAAACPAVCDCLVDAAVVAALHGLKLAACGVPAS